VLDVKEAVGQAVEHARRGEGPTLVECKTYRYRGHSRSDPRKYRTKEEEQYWHARDPIALFSEHCIQEGVLTAEEVTQIDLDVQKELREAEDFALNQSPDPDPAALLEDVYAGYIEGDLGLLRL
jgi:TPP-dependent pyruvate/acetoin dehydrogenase alpha subunit